MLKRAVRLSLASSLLLVSGACLSTADEAADCPVFADGSEGLPTNQEWRTHPAFGDVDGDGQLDIAGLPRKGRGPAVWLGNGKGQWKDDSVGLMMPGFSCGIGVDFADVDGDGDLELGIADHCNGIHVFDRRADAVWQLRANPATHRVRGGFDDMQFGDLNGDGHVDIVATGATKGGFAVLLGDGTGRWKKAKTGLPDRGYAPDIKLGDIDGDGDLDVVAAFTSSELGPEKLLPRLPVVWVNQGDLKFESFSSGLPQEGDFRGVALGDVNGDQLLDLLISAGRWPGRSPLLVFLQPSAEQKLAGRGWTPVPGGQPEVPGNEVFEGASLAHLNGDKFIDLVAVRHHEAGLRVWRGTPTLGFEECTDTNLPLEHEDERGWGVTVADVNRDGLADLAYAHGRVNRGAIEVWIQERPK